MKWQDSLFWRYKQPSDNEWRPQPGRNPKRRLETGIPAWLRKIDVDATCVDAAPFICGAGGLTHLRQLNSLGWTAPASIFRNTKTMHAMNSASRAAVLLIFACQALDINYRNYIPRWCHDRERRRDELEVREHVETGEFIGLGIWVGRMVFGVGRAYSFPMEFILGGALSDLAHREYYKSHGL